MEDGAGENGATSARRTADARAPKVVVLSMHPAPYRDPVLAAVAARRNVDLKVCLFSETEHDHREWEWRRPLDPSIVLDAGPARRGRAGMALRLLQFLARTHSDVVVVPGYRNPLSALAVAWSQLKGTPLILLADTLEPTVLGSSRSALRESVVRFILRRASAYWVPGRGTRAYLRTRGVADDAVFEGAYCFDAARMASGLAEARARRSELRARRGIPDDVHIFMTVGRAIASRRFDLLLDAFAALPDRRARLFIVGDGPEVPALEARRAASGDDRVLFVAGVPFSALPDLYAVADTYVHPGAEPFSTATEIAALAGMPIVASEGVGYVHDLEGRGASPLLFESGDVDGLSEALNHALGDDVRLGDLGRRLQAAALSRDLEWAAQEFEKAVARAQER